MAVRFRAHLGQATRFVFPTVVRSSSFRLPSGLQFAFRWSLVLALAFILGVAPEKTQAATIAFVQVNSAVPQTATSVPVTFTKAQTAGDLNVVVIGWSTPTATVSSVTDSKGNVYTLAAGPTVRTGTAAQAIYYASNIAAAAANGNTVTVTFSASAASPDIRIAEYSGIASSAPVDVSVGASGSSGTSSSGSVTTNNANDLLVGANYIATTTTKAGSGYTSRVITSPDGDILEDKTVTAVGSQSATATLSSGWWVMQMVAFRAAPVGPTVSSVSPNTGPVGGGTVVTITGTNFASGATVKFGTQAATSVTFQSATQILATTPAGVAGAVTVTVTAGGQSGSLASGFTYVATPTVSGVSPSSGTTSGGTGVTITGTNFVAGATVKFGTVTATNVTVTNSTTITATTPAGSAGAVTVTVTNPGALTGSLTNGFTYVVIPTVSGVSPNTGPVGGGTAVTITGTNFASGATVMFGTQAAAGVTVTNSTTITATTPAGSVGAVTVTVTVAGQSGSLASGFTYVATPTVSGVSPSSGSTSGGTGVTITGTNFVAGATVKFGTATATNVTVTNSTTMTATTPAGSAGAVTVTVTVGGQSGSLASGFTYVVTPTVSSVSPNTGPVGGGTAVTITGTNFASGATVTFGTQAATNVAVTNSTTITATTPAGSAGAVTVTVTVGGQSGSLASGFTYVATPTVSGVSPSSGSTLGGTAVTITGTNFVAGAMVKFGTATATNVTVTNSTTMTATTPAGSAGAVSVTVTVGGQSGSLANAFTYTVVISSTISYVQGNYATPQSSQTTVSVPFTAAQTAGDLNVIVVGWNNGTSTVGTVTDKSGNPYTLAVGPTVISGTASQSIYYAKNIAAAAAGANSVTVTFSAAAPAPDIRILEYKGADPNTPVDMTAASNGSSATSSSGSATTTNASDLIFGANYVATLTSGPGSGSTERILTSPDGDIAEDQMVTSTGSYSATATLSSSGWWVMQMVAFRASGSGGGTSPTIASLSPNSGAVGAAVTITGTNFGSSQGTSTVTFSGTPATPTSWSPTTIVAPVPSSATTGNVIVTVGGSASNGVNFSVTSINVTLSPRRAAVTMLQTQQFTATVNNDPQNGGVTWSVDGNNGGTSASGTVTPTGLFTPGTQAGVHVVTATSNSNTSMSASSTIAVTDLAGVFTYHNDSARTGQNLQEYALTTATVNSSTFGPLFTCPVDGYVYSAPLYVANFAIGGQTRNVVFIATENDSVYAFDADSPSCVQLWKKSFLSAGVTAVPAADVNDANQDDIDPQIGITSTPVIDPSASIMYVTAYTEETVGSGCSKGSPCFVYRLHALDLATGTEESGGPVAITAPNFNVQNHLQRPALLFNNGNVYIAFGSHGDNNIWQGWLMAYNTTGLTQEWVWHSTDPTSGNNEGSIWGSGNGPALDASGNIYVETANGTFDGVTNFSDSVVKVSPSGTMVDYFTPFDQGIMQQNDIDLGSSGPIILPDALGSPSHPHLLIATGKVGVIYLLDQTNLGKYNSAANQDVGESTVGFNTTDTNGGFNSQPAYWNGNIYGAIVGDALRQYPISDGVVAAVSSSESSNTYSYRGAAPAVSASGTTNGIVWAVDFSGKQNGTPLVLYAYDATNVSTLLYASPSSGSGAAATASKFTVPVVANGKVYVVGQSAFTVFGLLPN